MRYKEDRPLPHGAPKCTTQNLSKRSAEMTTLEQIEDVELPDSYGSPRRIGDLWADQPAVLVWLRHYG